MNILRIFNLLSLFLFLQISVSHAAVSVVSLQSKVDWSCVQFKITGVCVKAIYPYVGVRVSYNQPVLLVETVKKPGDSAITEYQPIVSSMTSAGGGLMSTAGGAISSGSSSTSNTDDTHTQFNEAHVYGFPFEQAFNSMVSSQCPENVENNQGPDYVSELDAVEGREGNFEKMNPKSLMSEKIAPYCAVAGYVSDDMCMGTWGNTYPRRGFVTNQSEVVGSAVASFRAVSIAAIGSLTPHIVTHQLAWRTDLTSDKIQPLYPNSGRCMSVGENPALWESGKTSTNGQYIWVYWKKKSCCIY